MADKTEYTVVVPLASSLVITFRERPGLSVAEAIDQGVRRANSSLMRIGLETDAGQDHIEVGEEVSVLRHMVQGNICNAPVVDAELIDRQEIEE